MGIAYANFGINQTKDEATTADSVKYKSYSLTTVMYYLKLNEILRLYAKTYEIWVYKNHLTLILLCEFIRVTWLILLCVVAHSNKMVEYWRISCWIPLDVMKWWWDLFYIRDGPFLCTYFKNPNNVRISADPPTHPQIRTTRRRKIRTPEQPF